MTTTTRTHRLAVARAWAGEDSLAPFVQRWVEDGHVVRDQFKPVIETLERLAQLVADAECPKPIEGDALVTVLTEVMREADRKFEKVGGSTRHHVRECLVPELEAAGLAVVYLPVQHPEQP